MCLFEKGSEMSQGTALISFSVGLIAITFATHILEEASIPLLMDSDELDPCGLFYNDISDRLIHSETGEFAQVIRDG